jgi:hypothetical protein
MPLPACFRWHLFPLACLIFSLMILDALHECFHWHSFSLACLIFSLMILNALPACFGQHSFHLACLIFSLIILGAFACMFSSAFVSFGLFNIFLDDSQCLCLHVLVGIRFFWPV